MRGIMVICRSEAFFFSVPMQAKGVFEPLKAFLCLRMKALFLKWSKRFGPAAVFLILAIGWGLRVDMGAFPTHIHAWTRADQYALALGFERNGLDFFHPETFVLNAQFPDKWTSPGTTGITATDFPIHAYVPAVLMKVFGSRSIAFFRWYVLLFAFAGLYFLWRWARLRGFPPGHSAIVAGFVLLMPVYLYYIQEPLVSVPALSCVFIGLFLWEKFRSDQRTPSLVGAIFWLTLAALTRTTFLIPWLALLGAETICMMQRRKVDWRIWTGFGAGAGLIVLYAWHNHNLRIEYGSQFLSSLMPSDSWSDAWELIGLMAGYWKWHWFTVPHYLLTLVAVVYLIRYKIKNLLRLQLSAFGWFSVLGVLGSVAFFVAMMVQFRDHDYYFVDAFAVPFVVLLMAALARLAGKEKRLTGSVALLLFVGLVTASLSVSKVNERNQDVPWDRLGATIKNFEGVDKLLDEMGYSREAHILVIDPGAPNVPLIQADRQGFVVMTTSKANLQSAIQWNYEVGIYQNEWLESDILPNWPDFMERILIVDQTEFLTFFKKREQ